MKKIYIISAILSLLIGSCSNELQEKTPSKNFTTLAKVSKDGYLIFSSKEAVNDYLPITASIKKANIFGAIYEDGRWLGVRFKHNVD